MAVTFTKQNSGNVNVAGNVTGFPAIDPDFLFNFSSNVLSNGNVPFCAYDKPDPDSLDAFLEGYIFNNDNWGSFRSTVFSMPEFGGANNITGIFGDHYLNFTSTSGDWGDGPEVIARTIEFAKALDDTRNDALAPLNIIEETFPQRNESNVDVGEFHGNFGADIGAIIYQRWHDEPGTVYAAAFISDGVNIIAKNAFKYESQGIEFVYGNYKNGGDYQTYLWDLVAGPLVISWTPEPYINLYDGDFTCSIDSFGVDDPALQTLLADGDGILVEFYSNDRFYINLYDPDTNSTFLLEMFPATLTYNVYELFALNDTAAVILSNWFTLQGFDDLFFAGLSDETVPLYGLPEMAGMDRTTRTPFPILLPCIVPCIPVIDRRVFK